MDGQESKVEQASAAVTPSEKELLKLVATVRTTTLSELLRTHSVNDLLQEGARIRDRLATLAAEGAHA